MTYAAVVEAIGRPDGQADVERLCRDLLEQVADGRLPILAVRHPLGFLCLPVIRGGDEGVCVHVWTHDAESLSTTSQVHCHSWDLVSYVLYGQVGNVVLSIQDSTGEDTADRIFEVSSRDGVDELTATPRLVRHREKRREIVGPGQVYRLAAGEFHRSFIIGPDAATLVLGLTRPVADLSLGAPDIASHSLSRQLCTPEDTRSAAQTVLNRLGG